MRLQLCTRTHPELQKHPGIQYPAHWTLAEHAHIQPQIQRPYPSRNLRVIYGVRAGSGATFARGGPILRADMPARVEEPGFGAEAGGTFGCRGT